MEQIEKKPNIFVNVIKKFFSILGWALIGVLFVWTAWSLTDRYTGYSCAPFGVRSSIIISSSMSKANPENKYLEGHDDRYQINDIVFATNYKSYYDIELYDVILFYSPKMNSLICHRVIDLYETNGTQYVVTQGDANNSPDAPISYSLVKGHVVNVWPGVGVVFRYLTSTYGIMGICIAAIFISGGILLYDLSKDRQTKTVRCIVTPIEHDSIE